MDMYGSNLSEQLYFSKKDLTSSNCSVSRRTALILSSSSNILGVTVPVKGGRIWKLHLMLWHPEKTRDNAMGNSGQGIYWQGSDKKPTDRMKPTGWGASAHGAKPRGAPCLYCKEDIVAGKITWGQVNPAREQMSPPTDIEYDEKVPCVGPIT